MTQPDAFLQSARERADEKGMRVERVAAVGASLSIVAVLGCC